MDLKIYMLLEKVFAELNENMIYGVPKSLSHCDVCGILQCKNILANSEQRYIGYCFYHDDDLGYSIIHKRLYLTFGEVPFMDNPSNDKFGGVPFMNNPSNDKFDKVQFLDNDQGFYNKNSHGKYTANKIIEICNKYGLNTLWNNDSKQKIAIIF